MTELKDFTGDQLCIIHNKLNPDKPISTWKGRKSMLIKRIERLIKANPCLAEEFKSEGFSVEFSDVPSHTTIRQTAIDLLCHVASYEDVDRNRVEPGTLGAYTVGIPYSQILRCIKEDFPDCNTNISCLRRYAVKIRGGELGYEDLILPRRRPRPSKLRS